MTSGVNVLQMNRLATRLILILFKSNLIQNNFCMTPVVYQYMLKKNKVTTRLILIFIKNIFCMTPGVY